MTVCRSSRPVLPVKVSGAGYISAQSNLLGNETIPIDCCDK
ncbi:hypothetical protein HMPREF1990_00307 [Porphyromonas gingivalis W4087]|nr:hypothetical protein HMPREF1990_00307 [Porphyromonas gingivalis W4087]